jgi:hypothetical protein
VPVSLGGAGSANIHRGFVEAADSLYEQVTSTLDSVDASKDKRIILTG